MEIVLLIQVYLFAGFGLTFFSDDLEKEPEVSPWIWIAFIWMILGAVRGVSYWLNPASVSALPDLEFDVSSGSKVERIVYGGVMAMGMVVLWTRRAQVLSLLKDNPWILALHIYMGLSIAWSDFGDVSFRRWVRSLGTLMMVLVVLTELNPVAAIKRMFMWFMGTLLPLSIILIYFFPRLGVLWTWDGQAMPVGVTLHKNLLGQLCAAGGLFLLWTLTSRSACPASERNKTRLLLECTLLAGCLWLMFGLANARSVTAIVSFVGGVACLIRIRVFKTIPWSIALFGIFLAVMLVWLWEPLQHLFFSVVGRDATLTGRVDLWDDLIAIGSRHSLVGTGFGAFWIGDSAHDLWSAYPWRPNEGHNGYIDVFVELGLIGLGLLAGVILTAFKNAWKSIRSNVDFGSLQLAVLFLLCLNNVGESTFIRTSVFYWFLFLLFGMKFQQSST